MAEFDLSTLLPATLALMREDGLDPSSDELLETIGIESGPTLGPGSPGSAPGTGHAAPREGTEEPVEGRLGRFQLSHTLGAGGMGRVLLARDPDLCRSVAVKVVLDPHRITAQQLGRFVAEARITSQLEHPNIVPVYEMGVAEDGQVYFAMKRVEGRSLRQVVDAIATGDPETTRHWTRHRLLTTFVQICNAVAYAHDRRVIHRDLKPDNVMVGAFGEVLVMDWGVARVLDGKPEEVVQTTVDGAAVNQTIDGSTIGTPGYMSPEQAGGDLDRLDPRSDVWCLGAILHELLTFKRAVEGDSALALLYASARKPAPDPRLRAPDANVPDEIAEVAVRAMARDPDERWQTASELAVAVEEYLAGSARRAAAERHLLEADAAWQSWQELGAEVRQLEAIVDEAHGAIDPWAGRADKAGLHEALDRLERIARERVDSFEDLVSACEKALSQDPENSGAHQRLARAHYARFERAEADGDEEAQGHHRRRVLRYDKGRFAQRLLGTGALTLHTDPPGATVTCERYVREGLIWPLVERQVLGTTPLEAVPLPRGSYRLVLSSPGKRDTVYPVHITRGRHWEATEPVPLFTDEQIGADWIYVPAGPCVLGGDPVVPDAPPRHEEHVPGFFIARLPFSMGQYCDFLDGLAAREPGDAWCRVPREESGLKDVRGQYWERPAPGGRFVVPKVDRDGDRWLPAWPVFAVSWLDAVAAGEWCTEALGVRVTLPALTWWEKASRGVDGRPLPWGDRFDPTLCKMRDSRPGRPTPEPVGTFADDRSPYGVQDTVGSIREWCRDAEFDGDPERRTVRGGGWDSAARDCRSVFRFGYLPSSAGALDGFRLARGLDGVFVESDAD